MSDDEATLEQVIDFATALVRAKRQELGARIGKEITRKFPRFNLHERGFTNFTDLLERAAPELTVVGRKGLDYVWGINADFSSFELTPADASGDSTHTGPWPALAPESIMLDSFIARRFKSLFDVQVPLRRFNVLVGANAAGKTSILEGLFLLSRLRRLPPHKIFSDERELIDLRTIGSADALHLEVRDSERGLTLAYDGLPEGVPEHQVTLAYPGGERRYDYADNTVPPQLHDFPLLKTFGGATLLRLEARNIARPWVSLKPRPTLSADGTGLPAVLADFAATDPDRLDTIFEETRTIVPAFEKARMPRQIVGFDADNLQIVGHGLELRIRGQWLNASLASEGTLLVLGLMTIVHGLSSTRLLLMDDIERGLHPKAQRILMSHLAQLAGSGRLQIVCSTHSPYFVDGAEPEDVLVVRASPADGFTRCRPLVEHEDWKNWRGSLSPGEFWSFVGEDWLEVV